VTPEQIGIPAFIILTLGGTFMTLLLRGALRLGREYEEMKAERDWWRSRAERGVRMAETATSMAERMVPPAGS
jgi:hypothetical protein